jgi:hypothetical protein
MSILTRVAVIAGVALAGICVAAPAQAADPAGLAEAKHQVTLRIDGRLSTLNGLKTAVDGAKYLTAGHRTTLTRLLADDVTGLTSLKTKVAGETTLAGVKGDVQSMINDYRVYILVVPKVRLTIGGDLAASAGARLQQAHDRLVAAVAKAKAAGKDTAAAEAKLADAQTKINEASAAIAGKTDTLLGVAPGPDAQAIHAQVRPVRGALRTARQDLRAALVDLRWVRDSIR